MEKELEEVEAELAKLQDWAVKFECEETIAPAAASLSEFRTMLGMLRQVWDIAQRADAQVQASPSFPITWRSTTRT